MSAEDPYDRTEPHASGANTDHDIIRILKIFNSLIINYWQIFSKNIFCEPEAEAGPRLRSGRQFPFSGSLPDRFRLPEAELPVPRETEAPARRWLWLLASLLQLTSTDPGHTDNLRSIKFNYYSIVITYLSQYSRL